MTLEVVDEKRKKLVIEAVSLLFLLYFRDAFFVFILFVLILYLFVFICLFHSSFTKGGSVGKSCH